MTRSVLYKKLYIIFYEITFVILLYGSTNVICTKRYFSTQVKYYKFQFEIQKRYIIFNSRKPFLNAKSLNPKTPLFNQRKLLQISVTNSKLQTLS